MEEKFILVNTKSKSNYIIKKYYTFSGKSSFFHTSECCRESFAFFDLIKLPNITFFLARALSSTPQNVVERVLALV